MGHARFGHVWLGSKTWRAFGETFLVYGGNKDKWRLDTVMATRSALDGVASRFKYLLQYVCV